jgi:C4-dicarboxylate-specific signal transduction histidine kinase
MRSDAENLVRINQRKFIGKILSVYAHDLNNHLGIIKEASGLMEDIVELNKSKDNRLKEELARPMKSIYSRVGDAAFMTSKLSAFGRGMEGGENSLDVNEIIGELLVLLKRMAAQRRIELVADFQADIPTVNADPLMLQFLIFCLMEDQLMRLKAKGRLIFRTVRSREVLSVMILSEGEAEQSDEKRTFPDGMAQLIAETCGLSIAVNSRDSRIILNL